MSNSKSEMNELKTLQREVTELRAKRKGQDSEAAPAAEGTSKAIEAQNGTEPPTQDSSGEKPAPEWDTTIQDIVTHLEHVAKEIDEATRERPMLGLMAAFTTGIVVGYLLSRRNS